MVKTNHVTCNNKLECFNAALLHSYDVLKFVYDIGSRSVMSSVTGKYRQMSIMISLEKLKIWHLHKTCHRLWEIWTNWLWPKALKSCLKSNKLPNLVTQVMSNICTVRCTRSCFCFLSNEWGWKWNFQKFFSPFSFREKAPIVPT